MSRFYQGSLDHLRQLDQLKAALAAELAKPTEQQDDKAVNIILNSLARLEVIPRMEADLAAEHQKPNPDRAAIEALRQEISELHRGELPDHIRAQLVASVAEPVVEVTP
jgi:hypothetical protein